MNKENKEAERVFGGAFRPGTARAAGASDAPPSRPSAGDAGRIVGAGSPSSPTRRGSASRCRTPSGTVCK